ncbi:ATP-binding cassette domain-containing protein [Halorubrum gandharaense]
MTDPILAVDDLKKHFTMTEGILKDEVGTVKAVDGITFEIREGETFGIVGESGCGKSTAARSILRLDEPTAGAVRFDGTDITAYDRTQLKRFRREAQMMFQDPESSFDPRMSVGESLSEPMRIHGMTDTELRRSVIKQLLERVGLQADDIDRYPHEFSGGQKQRIGLARALVLNPRLLVADEPVSALDVSVQAEILQLMGDLQDEFGLSILIISHNLGVVREICDRVGVMYLGEMVEVGPTEELFSDPQHPYTRALISAIPSADITEERSRVHLSGNVPDPSNPPRGCRFHTRCPEVVPPEEYAFEEGVWRSVLDVKRGVEMRRFTVDRLYELVHPEEAAAEDAEIAETLPVGDVDESLRREYGVPATLSDADAETVFADAIEALANGDVERAGERLDAFETVCQREQPDLVEVGDDHVASCHLTEQAEDERPVSEVGVSD